ncbi:hypothetical protein M0811_05112 [Anaeramoeba ignava]|uniref:Uncharacterized protein n=1 Tax=Anaeramoeba ignava TaxID=1746090 RepID=A0A9Q0RFN9_ANAIG|nr:hypothetical protein M0811_05112 [Anaeramoeba ignava]
MLPFLKHSLNEIQGKCGNSKKFKLLKQSCQQALDFAQKTKNKSGEELDNNTKHIIFKPFHLAINFKNSKFITASI